MAEMMNCFVMHGIGKVGMIAKAVPRPGPGDAITDSHSRTSRRSSK